MCIVIAELLFPLSCGGSTSVNPPKVSYIYIKNIFVYANTNGQLRGGFCKQISKHSKHIYK